MGLIAPKSLSLFSAWMHSAKIVEISIPRSCTDRRWKHGLIFWIMQNLSATALHQLLAIGPECLRQGVRDEETLA